MIEASLIGDALALAVTFGVSGVLLGLIVLPDRLGAVDRLGVSLALAVPGTIVAAAPALVVHRLGAVGGLLGLAVLAVVAALRVGAPLARAREAAGAARRALRNAAPARVVLFAAGALAAWFAVLGPQLSAGRVEGFPRSATVWYYWRLVAESLADGGLPSGIAEWGGRQEFPSEYAVTTLHGATTAALAGGADLDLLERYRLVLVVLALIAAWALWNRWLPAWWAWLASILTLAAAKTSFKFTAYRPEVFGLLLVLWSAWLFDQALERRSPRWGALAGVVSACAFLAHAEAWLLTAPLWVGIAASRLLPGLLPGRAGVGGRRMIRAAVLPLAVCALAFTLTATVVSVGSDGGGRLVALVGLGEGGAPKVQAGIDPTWQIHAAMYNVAKLGTRPPNYCERPFARPASRFPYARVSIRDTRTRLVLGGGLLLLLASLPFVPSSLRRGVLVWSVFAVGMYLLSEALCRYYTTFVPERAGPLRLLPYYATSLAGLLGALGFLAFAGTGATLRRVLPERLRSRSVRGVTLPSVAAVAVGAAASVALLAALTPLGAGRVALDEAKPLSPDAHEAYVWIRDHVPADSLVMANVYTEGSLGAISGRAGLLDGRLPYLESERFRSDAINDLLATRRYLTLPQVHRSSLPPEVSHVLIAAPEVNIGGLNNFPVNWEGLRASRDLRLQRSFADGRLLLFEVRDPRPLPENVEPPRTSIAELPAKARSGA